MTFRLGFQGSGLALCLLFACSNAAPNTFEVSGRVTWNGTPLSNGDIIFAAADGGPIEDHGQIVDGLYRFRARAGKKLVRITANRATGKIDPIMGEAPREQYLPERYNSQTTLTADVGPGGKNEWDYALTAAR